MAVNINKPALSSTQNFLLGQIKHWAKENKHTVTLDDGQYYQFNNGCRSYTFNFYKDNKTFLGIREDGNTRFVFNGIVEDFEDFKKVDYLTQ